MWTCDILEALKKIFEIYGMYCCIDKIEHNLIYMSNFEVWRIKSDGSIEKVK